MREKDILTRIKEDVIRFDADDIRAAAGLALEAGIVPERVVNEALLPAMKVIGERYEADEFFLPDMIMAAEAMNEATKILFSDLDEGLDEDPEVVIATVKGDIHDIGKNILSNLLAGSGISVYDLGVDTSGEEIVESIKRFRPRVLGLSSMISTTRGEIKKVIKELEGKGLKKDLKILIGGASVDRVFAKTAGADAYAKDAFTGVEIIKGWL